MKDTKASLLLKVQTILVAGLLVLAAIANSSRPTVDSVSAQTVVGTPPTLVFLPYIAMPPLSPTDTPITTINPQGTPTTTPTPSASAPTGTPTQTPTSTPPAGTPTTTPTQTSTPTPLPAGCAPTQTGWTVIACQDFEGTFPDPFSVFDDNGGVGPDFEFAPKTCQAFQGAHGAWAVGGGTDGSTLACGAVYPSNADSWMLAGPIDLTQATAAELTFKLWLNTKADHDYVCRYASIDGIDYFGTCTSGSTNGWVDESLDLTNVFTLGNVTGQSTVWVAIVFTSDASTGLPGGANVDNVILQSVGGTVSPPSQAISRFSSTRTSNVTHRFGSTRRRTIAGTPTAGPSTPTNTPWPTATR